MPCPASAQAGVSHSLAGLVGRSGTRLLRDNLDERRIASSSNAPEWTGHCLTRMLPSLRHFVNWVTQSPLSCSIGEPAFPSRPGTTAAAARSVGDGRSGATRSHAQRALSREHGEDGEHQTFPAVSTVAQSALVGGAGHLERFATNFSTEHHFMRHFTPPAFQPALQRPDLPIWENTRLLGL